MAMGIKWHILSVGRAVAICLALAPQAAHPALSGSADDKAAEEFRNAQEYEDCMTLARRTPEDGFESALAWAAQGGGEAAQHCAAVAQIGLGDYAGAAVRLEKAGGAMPADRVALAAELLAQAGQAWFMAGELERAHGVQAAALKLAPDNVDLLVDRALTRAAAQNYWEAIDDLNRAAELAPERADILVYRASAYRYVDGIDLAREDVERALQLDPDDPAALLERGTIRRLTDDPEGARQDWLKVVTQAAGTPAGDAAQANLERLDLKAE